MHAPRRLGLVTLTLLACLTLQAQAAPITCLPKPVGSGSAVLVKSTPKGDFAAWHCPGEPGPTLVVCLKAACGLVGAKRAVAAWASEPTLAGLNQALQPYQRSPHADAELRAVWAPYSTQVNALRAP